MSETKAKSGRHPSNIIFNLIALGLLLTVIVFLHQILKKPKPEAPVETAKSVSALPAPVSQTLPPLEPVAVEPEKEKAAVVELPVKEPEAKPVVLKAETKPVTKKSSSIAENEISPAELDGEEARRRYIEDNKRLSSGDAKIERSPTKAAPRSASNELDREAATRFEPRSSYDLDDEAARQKYNDENRRLSRTVNTRERPKEEARKPASTGGDEYIPFENR